MSQLQKSNVHETSNRVPVDLVIRQERQGKSCQIPNEKPPRTSSVAWTRERRRTTGPLTPALTPSEWERENQRPRLHPALKGWAIFIRPFGTLSGLIARNFGAPAVASVSLLFAVGTSAATLAEDFSTNPSQNGWQIFGNTNLFGWDATNHQLAVTWD